MAQTTRQMKQVEANGMLNDISDHVTRTAAATVTEAPGRQELMIDAALIAAGMLEAISPPLALAGIAINRLARTAK